MSVSKLKIVEFTNPYRKTLGINAQQIVAKRYALKDLKGNPLESWDDIVKRVVSHVAKAEKDFMRREEFTANMLRLMEARAFVPNTPCLVNAGKPKGQLAACFVLPVPDSIDGIMEHAKYCALIHQSGGGTGFCRWSGTVKNGCICIPAQQPVLRPELGLAALTAALLKGGGAGTLRSRFWSRSSARLISKSRGTTFEVAWRTSFQPVLT